ALVAGFALIAALHLADPDRLTARVNTERAASGRRFDAGYNGSLSADAVPVLVDALPRLSARDRCATAARIRRDWTWPSAVGGAGEAPGWRSWNLARARAWRSVSENWLAVSGATCPAGSR
ncbi:MAG TPA: DUF4153 domain-containing protein, partial [Terriglobia bacterium]|nr:DUF4153 domain-containing protein [Terriglobia bacterium]